MKDLLPCPFCGGSAEIVDAKPRIYGETRLRVKCTNRDCGVWYPGYSNVFKSTEDAIQSWNTRFIIKEDNDATM